MHKFKNLKNTTDEKVLFLPGVFKKDCQLIEDMFRDKLLIKDKKVDDKVFDKIPSCFTTLENWPKKTNLKCWSCHRYFNSIPWFEPQAIEPICLGSVGKFLSSVDMKKLTNQKIYNIPAKGNFCSCNCVQEYIDRNTKDLSDKINKKKMLEYVYMLIKGKKIIDIRPSPHYTNLKQYGGNYSETEYQHKIDSLEEALIQPTNIDSLYEIYLKALTEEIR